MEETGRKQYSLVQIEVPMGFGAKYYIKDHLYVGMEVLHRKTFTDYMDDVSTTYIDETLFDKYLTPEQADLAKKLYFRTPELGPNIRTSYFPSADMMPWAWDFTVSTVSMQMSTSVRTLGTVVLMGLDIF